MKKILSIALVIAMMLALSVPAMAAATELEDEVNASIEGKTTDNVTVKVESSTPGEDPTAIYSVEVVWESLEFVYSGVWNADDGWYEANDEAGANGWQDAEALITVTNKSNAPVDVDAHFGNAIGTVSAEMNGVTATLGNYDFQLGSASTEGATLTNQITVTVTGNPKADQITVGTITVTLHTVD